MIWVLNERGYSTAVRIKYMHNGRWICFPSLYNWVLLVVIKNLFTKKFNYLALACEIAGMMMVALYSISQSISVMIPVSLCLHRPSESCREKKIKNPAAQHHFIPSSLVFCRGVIKKYYNDLHTTTPPPTFWLREHNERFWFYLVIILCECVLPYGCNRHHPHIPHT